MDSTERSAADTERSKQDVGDSDRHDGENLGGADAALSVISRQEARERGLKRYFTGKPCPRGHVAERGVASKSCMECIAKKIAEYRENPEYRAERSAEQAKRYKDDPEVRRQQLAQMVALRKTPDGRVRSAAWHAVQVAKRRAERQAKFATETLGIPHTVVKMEDGTFQPVPVTT